LEQRATHHGVVERPRPPIEPADRPDCHLDLSAEALLRDVDLVVERVTVGCSEHEEIDVSDGTDAAFASVASRPRAEDVRVVDSFDVVKGVGENGWQPKAFVRTSASPS
jgi:hypothetical protein